MTFAESPDPSPPMTTQQTRSAARFFSSVVRRRSSVVCAAALLLAILLPTLPAAAQETPALPDIAPREFEIRGDLVIRFPSLERQPLTGFNPPPRVFEMPVTYTPFIGTYKLDAADLPPSPLRPPQPPPATLTVDGAANGTRLEAAFGSLATRELGFDLNRASRTGYFQARIDYDGTAGHSVLPTPTAPAVDAHHDALDAALGWTWATARFDAGVEATGVLDAYSLYGAVPTDSARFNPKRTAGGGGVGAWIRSVARSPVRYDVQVNYDLFGLDTEAPAGADGALFLRDDQRVSAHAQLDAPVGRNRFELSGTGTLSGQNTGGSNEATDLVYDAGGRFRLVSTPQLDLALGARAVGFTATANGQEDWANYVGPDVLVRMPLGRRVQLTLSNTPFAHATSLADVVADNPYASAQPRLLPNIAPLLNAEAGLTVQADPARITGFVRYTDFIAYRFYEAAPATGYDTGFFQARYGNVQLIEAGGTVAVRLTDGVSGTVRFGLRDASLGGDTVPYLAPVHGAVVLNTLFLDGRGLFQLEGVAEGARPVDRTASRRLDPYARLDLHAAYDLGTQFALYLRARNVLSTSYQRWEGYPAAPAVGLLGLRVRW